MRKTKHKNRKHCRLHFLASSFSSERAIFIHKFRPMQKTTKNRFNWWLEFSNNAL
jgi:hypothetical protein